MRSPFAVLLALATALALSFLLLPILAIFVDIPPGQLLDGMNDPAAIDALVVTLKTTLIANAVILLVGTPAAYLIGSHWFRAKPLLVTAVELPLVLPPAVAGIGLLAAFGRFGLLGGTLDVLGVSIPFTQLAVVFAVGAFVLAFGSGPGGSVAVEGGVPFESASPGASSSSTMMLA